MLLKLSQVLGVRVAYFFRPQTVVLDALEYRKHNALPKKRLEAITNQVIDQIEAQLERLVPVHKVVDLTASGPHVERELALIKVSGKGEARVEALRVAEIFRASVVDTTTESFIFELTGAPGKIDSFITLMRQLGLVSVGRSGVVGMMRGLGGA
jgi:acetolactate synthase-1/3 small subunit